MSKGFGLTSSVILRCGFESELSCGRLSRRKVAGVLTLALLLGEEVIAVDRF